MCEWCRTCCNWGIALTQRKHKRVSGRAQTSDGHNPLENQTAEFSFFCVCVSVWEATKGLGAACRGMKRVVTKSRAGWPSLTSMSNEALCVKGKCLRKSGLYLHMRTGTNSLFWGLETFTWTGPKIPTAWQRTTTTTTQGSGDSCCSFLLCKQQQARKSSLLKTSQHFLFAYRPHKGKESCA